MTDARLSREHLDALLDVKPDARVSGEFAEALVAPKPDARLSGEYVEALAAATPSALVSRTNVEVLIGTDPLTRTVVSSEHLQVLVRDNSSRGQWGRSAQLRKVSTFTSSDTAVLTGSNTAYTIPLVFDPGAVTTDDLLIIASMNTTSNNFATANAGANAPFDAITSAPNSPYGTLLSRKYDGTEGLVSLTAPGGSGRKTITWASFPGARMGQVGQATASTNNTLAIPQDLWFRPGDMAVMIAFGVATNFNTNVAPAPWRTHVRARDSGTFVGSAIYSWVCDTEGLAPGGNLTISGTSPTSGAMMARIHRF